MRWVAPTEKETANQTLERRLWAAADPFWEEGGAIVYCGSYLRPGADQYAARIAVCSIANQYLDLVHPIWIGRYISKGVAYHEVSKRAPTDNASFRNDSGQLYCTGR